MRGKNTTSPRSYLVSRKNWIILIVILVLGMIVSLVYFSFFRSQIDSSKYQAVFLTNGQVYFGKLKNYYTERPYLTDVYYIQAQDGTAAEGAPENATSDQQLVKLGSEVHAPENTMILNKSSILFVENLTDEGKVVQLIQQNQKAEK